MDLVYPLRDESDDDYFELKYSLRSMSNVPHDRVIIVGGKPSWITNIVHIKETDSHSLKGYNSMRKLLAAFNVVSEDFIYMNDDFFMLKEQNIQYFHQGKLKDNVERRGPLLNFSRYWAGMKRVSILFEEPLDYEIHYPFIFNKNRLLEMTNKYDMDKQYSLRSLYGNEFGVGGEFMKDNKVYAIEDFKGDLFVSSSDQLHTDGALTKALDKMFPRKSIYEL